MKKMAFLLVILITVSFISCKKQSVNKDDQTVNAVLGDVSFVQKFGVQPDASTDEELRIKTHLAYVEKLLRNKDVSGLSPNLRAKREHLLDLLHNYWKAGIFPRNFDFPNKRVPCFMDRDGRVCAVGYLIEQTAGRKVTEEINRKYKYKKVLAIHDPGVGHWIAQSGLTKVECAMIQPTYGPPPTPVSHNCNDISTGYGITSSLVGGLNLSLSAINAIQIAKGRQNKAVPVIGLISGTGQILLGALNIPKTHYGVDYTCTNETKKTLSLVNIGLGTTTMILSSWNLLANRPEKEKSLSWNIYGYPTSGNQIAIGLYVRKSF